ncbi:hypothetical protein [Rugosimonospora africana]|uniref:Uncharacterized protein n=1 Tax=Rugosimonospora africana TaxID=556532 RepID=A0A8J3QZR9_9ACTN|nr:hypothetical protein [Rugosimonospora africana]GIH19229.1 hypothetical protein Raf01_74010 [Rugosimonospora africana]
MAKVLDVIMLVAVALLGYLAGRRFPHVGGRISRWGSRCRAAVVRPPGPWRRRSRLLFVAGAFAATAPVWPITQPAVADDRLEPAEVAVVVPVVLVFPVAWALLGRSRPYAWRVAVALVACVAGWSLWTVAFGSFGTPPTMDDGLRWYLIGTGTIVACASTVEVWHRRPPRRPTTAWLAGALGWAIGVAATVTVPVVGDQQLPPRDAVLPLPPAMAVAHEEARCGMPGGYGFGPRSCFRRFTISATDGTDGTDGTNGMDVRELARRLGEHLRQTKGWPVAWDEVSAVAVGCRPGGWLDPYELCLDLRPDESTSTVTLRLAYDNRREPVVY